MQSETADFAPGATTCRYGRNIRIVLDSGPSAPLRENMTSSRKPATGDMYRKFGETWTCNCRDMRADRQTDKQTDKQTDVLDKHADYTPASGEVK